MLFDIEKDLVRDVNLNFYISLETCYGKYVLSSDINSLRAKKQTTKFTSANFQKM